MTADKARKRNRKRYFKLRKNRPWVSVILYILIFVIGLTFMKIFLSTFTVFALKSKLSSEYDTDLLLAKQYEREMKEGNPDPYSIMDESGKPYLIRDSEDKVIQLKGRNTCAAEGHPFSDFDLGLVAFTGDYNNIMVYPDTETEVIELENDRFVINYSKLFQATVKAVSEIDGEEKVNNKGLEIPVWLSVSVMDGQQMIFFRSAMTVGEDELVFIIMMFLIMVLLMMLVLLVMIVSTIGSAVRQAKVTRLFFTDMVTKGHNWMWYLFKGEKMLRKHNLFKGTGLAVVSVSFVGYRRFCVCHSIEEGERTLCGIYRSISSQIHKRKELCAHISEGNYALLLRYKGEEQLKERIDNMLRMLTESDPMRRFAFHAGVDIIKLPKESWHKLFFRGSDIDIEQEYNNARTAEASLDTSDGSGAAYFDDKFVEEQKWIDTVQARQQAALENREFVIYYQPKYDPRTSRLRGAEALIRWQSPEFGFVTPYRFIPLFEKNGFITEIDHYMVTNVARDQRRWLDMGYKCVPVSVNISRAHFIEPDLAEQIRDMVDAEGTPHELIEIELTESAFFDDKRAMVTTINRLKKYGFSVSMDDFGSGYSSLNSLKDMPLDVLKLDAEFFRGEMADTDRGEIVVSEAIKLAKSLNMRTVAEGVEVREQVEFLASQGCDMIQGYYFAKPMPGDEYQQRMNK